MVVELTVKPEHSTRPLSCSTHIVVMFEGTKGTSRSLAASQETSSPWHLHSTGTAPATAGRHERDCGGRFGVCYDRMQRKEIQCKRTVKLKDRSTSLCHIRNTLFLHHLYRSRNTLIMNVKAH